MTIMEMLGQSGILTVLGMGIVFGFLVIMVISVSTMGKIVQALSVSKGAAVPNMQESIDTGQTASQDMNKAVTAAITAAVTEYQKDH